MRAPHRHSSRLERRWRVEGNRLEGARVSFPPRDRLDLLERRIGVLDCGWRISRAVSPQRAVVRVQCKAIHLVLQSICSNWGAGVGRSKDLDGWDRLLLFLHHDFSDETLVCIDAERLDIWRCSNDYSGVRTRSILGQFAVADDEHIT